MTRIAIQGEAGSNSHRAALQAMQRTADAASIEIFPCASSADVFDALEQRRVEAAVLPIENSLHGSVAEHFDLLLEHSVCVVGETTLHIQHNVIAAPGVPLEDVREIWSHPVALSQCRQWLRSHPTLRATPTYDTAGSVKLLMEAGRRDVAGLAPELAAAEYGAEVILAGVEDHAENFTRFFVLERLGRESVEEADKASLAFSVAHRPGTLLAALATFREAGLNLTKIESRPVHGRPWEYVFFVDVRFEHKTELDAALAGLRTQCDMVKVLGLYCAA